MSEETKEHRILGKIPPRALDDSFRVFIVVITAVIYSLGLIWFLQPAGIYASGVSGLSQILKNLIDTVCVIPLGVYTLCLNIPLFIYGWRKVSKRFAIFSLISVLVQTICTLDIIPVDPVVDSFGLDPSTNQLTYAIIGAILTGVSCGIALRFGTSTGGLDILGQVLAMEKNIPIGVFTMIANVLIAICGGAIVSGSWPIAFYSCIRIIITSLCIDKIHTSYNYVKLNIISSNANESMLTELLSMHRGCTIIPVEGAYSHQKKVDLIMVVSSYEVDKTIRICKKHDPKCFIIVEQAKRVYGNYTKKSIV